MGVLRHFPHQADHFLHRGAALLRRGAHVLRPGKNLRGALENLPDRPGGPRDHPVHRVGHVPDFLDGRVRLHGGGEVAGLGHVPGPLGGRPEGPGQAPGEEDDHDGGHHEDGYDADVDRPAHGSHRGEGFRDVARREHDVAVRKGPVGHGLGDAVPHIVDPALFVIDYAVGVRGEAAVDNFPESRSVELQGGVVEIFQVPVEKEGIPRIVDLHRIEDRPDEIEGKGHPDDGGNLAVDEDRLGIDHHFLAAFGKLDVAPVGSDSVKGPPEPCGGEILPVDELGGIYLLSVEKHEKGTRIRPFEGHHVGLFCAVDLRVENDEQPPGLRGLDPEVGHELAVLGAELGNHDVRHLGVGQAGEPGGDEG
ncbi:hypothetical protein SDC9_102685 [bioreactor metagenome]|uniref:Uncharacterized protein n=1 Tax=bioreactor metagenome TaxID=1076179 RepID=A0A645AS35_9ZZZZ